MEAILLGRDVELGQLDAAWRGGREGRGGLVVVEGTAGTGKSALLAAAEREARRAGLRVLDARGGLLERDFPFGVARQLFEAVLERADPAERRRWLDGAARPAAAALALDGGAAAPGSLPAVLHALYWLTANVAAQGPLALAVDDAHWADESSLHLLSYLARRVGDLPVVLLVALRPAEPGAPGELLDELALTPHATRLTLAPLGPDAIATLVRRRVPGADDAFCAACHAASAGNPFYLDELLRAIGDPAAADADAVRGAATASLGERVGRRVARLGPRARALAEAMAVLPDGSRLAEAAALAGIDHADAGGLAHRLRRIEILIVEDPFAFTHPLVRASLYDAIPAAGRDAAHLAAARLLEDAGAPPAAVAAQMAARAPSGSGEAAAALVEAAERALEQAAPHEAVHSLRRALQEGAPAPPRAAILAALGVAEMALHDAAAVPRLEEAFALTADPVPRARLAVLLAVALFVAGRGAEAIAILATGREALGARDADALAELEAVALMVVTYTQAGAIPGPERFAALEPLTRGDSWNARELAAMLAGMAAHQGHGVQRVTELLDRALDGPLLYDVRRPDMWAAAHILVALIETDQLERALALCDELDALARPDGSLFVMLAVEAHRAWALARAGDLGGAEAHLRSCLRVTEFSADPIPVVAQLFYTQEALVERPSLDDVAALVEALDPAPLAGSFMAAMAHTPRGRLRLLRRDGDGAEADLRVAHELAVASGMSPAVGPSGSLLALALGPTRRAEALALVDEELAMARRAGLARAEGIALRAAGLLRTGAEAIERLEAAVAVLAPSPARLEHARALVALGAALRRGQRRADAREPLAAGLELAHACGATRLEADARDELRAAGGRPRRVARTGRDALTASEQRIARLAVDGASNAEIAQELFVSLKTVETHLSSVYRKLGLAGRGSRDRLAEALATPEPFAPPRAPS